MVNKNMIHSLIEVAYFKSSFSDVAGTEEGEQKGSTPKGYSTCSYIAWA